MNAKKHTQNDPKIKTQYKIIQKCLCRVNKTQFLCNVNICSAKCAQTCWSLQNNPKGHCVGWDHHTTVVSVWFLLTSDSSDLCLL